MLSRFEPARGYAALISQIIAHTDGAGAIGSMRYPRLRNSRIIFARSVFLRFSTDRRSSLLVPHALVQDLPDQSTQPVGDRTDRLGMSQARDDAAVHDGKDRPLGFHRGVGGLIQDASHLSIASGAAVTVVDAGTLLIARARAHPGGELFR